MKKNRYVLLVNHWLFISYSCILILFMIGFVFSFVYLIFPSPINLSLIFIPIFLFLVLCLIIFVIVKFLCNFIILENDKVIQKGLFREAITFNVYDVKKMKTDYVYREGKFIMIYIANTFIKIAYSKSRVRLFETYLSIKCDV